MPESYPACDRGFRYGAAVLPIALMLFAAPALAWAEESITLDFVRHGESTDNVAGIVGTAPPGAELSTVGQQQAQALADALAGNTYAGIYASELVRTQETAAPLADALGMQVQYLPGLNEIGAGIYEGDSTSSAGAILYGLPTLLWAFGLLAAPIPGSTDPNGIVFDHSFDNAVQTIYENTAEGTGSTTGIVFSSAQAIEIWTLLNVNNPDPLLLFTEPLGNTDQVVVTGNPTDGWTLISWAGVPVPAPTLGTELFVDLRTLIEAPQLATYQILEAITGGDPTSILPAVQTALEDFGTALVQFPESLLRDIVDAVQNLASDTAGAMSV